MKCNSRIIKQGAFNTQKVYYRIEANALNAFINLKPSVPKHPDYSVTLQRRDLPTLPWYNVGQIYQGQLTWVQR